MSANKLRNTTACALWLSLGAALLFVALRRISGETLQTPQAGVVVLWLATASCWMGAAWVCWRLPQLEQWWQAADFDQDWRIPQLINFQQVGWPEWLVLGLFSASVLVVAPPLSPESWGGIAGALVAIVSLIVVVHVVPEPLGVSFSGVQPEPSHATYSSLADQPEISQVVESLAAGEADISADTSESLAEHSMVRRRDSLGETVEGTIAVTFEDDSRETQCHLAFAPVLCGWPDVELEEAEGNDWDLRIAACYPFGIRIAIRRRPNSPRSGRIRYHVSALKPSRQAG